MYALSGKTETHTICGNSVHFLTDSYSEFRRFRDLVSERDVITEVLESLEPADVFYDVGANIGMYTCFVANELGADRIVAFEPHEESVDRLRENLQHNNLDAKIIPVALSDIEGKVDLAVAGDQVGEGEHAIATGRTARTVEVEVNRGDGLIDRCDLPEPTVIKIDVEGAEFAVLNGLRSTLQESCRLVFCEIHPRKIQNFDANEGDVYKLLRSYGFEIEAIHQRGSEHFIKAEKRTKI
ncbi:FkbM family methyltransferase [Salinirubellus salinus]|uniref:FkbM family methyltransferase n=1 Tax=Salinirubellus salinus TaxID=1364945 RepID=UPI00361645E7